MKKIKVEIYTCYHCGYCFRAKKLFEEKGVAFDEIDVSFDPEKRREMEKRASGETSVPQIFINNLSVGGCEDIYRLDQAGKLADLLNGK